MQQSARAEQSEMNTATKEEGLWGTERKEGVREGRAHENGSPLSSSCHQSPEGVGNLRTSSGSGARRQGLQLQPPHQGLTLVRMHIFKIPGKYWEGLRNSVTRRTFYCTVCLKAKFVALLGGRKGHGHWKQKDLVQSLGCVTLGELLPHSKPVSSPLRGKYIPTLGRFHKDEMGSCMQHQLKAWLMVSTQQMGYGIIIIGSKLHND